MRSILIAVLLFASTNTFAATIDFEDQTVGGGTGFVESGGFTFTTNFSPEGGIIVVSPGASALISGDYSLAWCPDCSLFMEKSSGAEFSFSSFDTYSLTTAVGPFALTGHRGDGSTVAISFTGTTSTQTVSLGGDWTGLTSVEFYPQYNGGLGHVIDNINVNVVPIPAAVWLFGSALAGLGWVKRKQMA